MSSYSFAEENTLEENPCKLGLISSEKCVENYYLTPNEFLSTRASLPKSVDLSTSPCFPPIGNQGFLNACTSYAITYYQFSYEVNKLNNVTSTNNRCVYSPKLLCK